MYTSKTLFKDFIEELINIEGCQDAIDWCKKIDKEGFTFGEAMECFLKDSSAKQGWASYSLYMFDKKLDGDIKKGFMEKISDPMSALKIFTKLNDLSEEEIVLLQSKFQGKLPAAEKEVRDKIITRSKNVNNIL